MCLLLILYSLTIDYKYQWIIVFIINGITYRIGIGIILRGQRQRPPQIFNWVDHIVILPYRFLILPLIAPTLKNVSQITPIGLKAWTLETISHDYNISTYYYAYSIHCMYAIESHRYRRLAISALLSVCCMSQSTNQSFNKIFCQNSGISEKGTGWLLPAAWSFYFFSLLINAIWFLTIWYIGIRYIIVYSNTFIEK